MRWWYDASAMPDKDMLSERGRSLEEDYFRKKDRELVEKMRRAAEAEARRGDLTAKTGITDPELLREVEALGFSPETVALLPIVPVIQMAWADREVSDAERKLVVQFARARGILDGSPADAQLSRWLTHQPAPAVFEGALRLVRAMLESSGETAADDLVKQAEAIAAASGGVFGINRISAEERALLTTIAGNLKK